MKRNRLIAPKLFVVCAATLLLASCDGKNNPPFLSSKTDAKARPKDFSDKNFGAGLNQSNQAAIAYPETSPITNEGDTGNLSENEKKSLDKLLSDLGRS